MVLKLKDGCLQIDNLVDNMVELLSEWYYEF